MKAEDREWFQRNKERLLNTVDLFTDPDNGRIMLNFNPIKNNEPRPYLWGNAGLFTGEVALLLKVGGILERLDEVRTTNAVLAVKVSHGLFSRNPDPYRYTADWKQVSHDEYLGVTYAAAAIPAIGCWMTEAVNRGKNSYWQFNDHPEFKPKPITSMILNFGVFMDNVKAYLAVSNPTPVSSLFKNPLKIIPNVIRYIDEARFRQNTNSFPYLWPLFSVHQPHLRFMYKSVSKYHKPSLYERLYFTAKVILGSLGRDKSNSDISGSRLMFLNLLTLQLLGEDKGLVGLASKFYNYRKTKEYGTDKYYHQMNILYFVEKDRDHAILTLSYGVTL